MMLEFMPIDYDYFDFDGRNHIKMFGRDSEGKKVCVVDTCPVYLWLILEKGISDNLVNEVIEEVREVVIQTKDRTSRVEKIEVVNKKFLGEDVKALKVYATNYKDLHAIASEIETPLVDKRRGYDLGFVTHYIIEKGIRPMNWYGIEAEEVLEDDFDFVSENLEVDYCLKLNSFSEISGPEYKPRALAYDIETDSLSPDQGEILMVALVGEDYKKVITWKKGPTENRDVVFVENERELINEFVKSVKEYSPDFLVGYNSDSFDMPYLKDRAKILKMKFPIGLDMSQPKVQVGIPPTVRIKGYSQIDLLRFVKTAYAQYMQSETLSLDNVANEFLGEKKIPFEFKHSSQIKDEEWDLYYKYNLHDSKITLDLFNKFWPDMLEFSKVVNEPVFDISRSGLSKIIESYILHNLGKFDEIPERRPNNREIGSRRNMGGVEGAFVFEPTPGLYEDLCMFDFTSMHTSIIISHNISKENLVEPSAVSREPSASGGERVDAHESPEIEIEGMTKKFHFKKEGGFFPTLLREIFEKRRFHKAEYVKDPTPMNKARSNAFKVLSASAHGYIGFYGARYYSWEASSTILAFVRHFNQETIRKIEGMGHKVIYGDTDSVAFTCEGKSHEEVLAMLEKLNSELPGVMNLELEGFFDRGIWVTTRSGETGAKKKYAMISDEGSVKIKGFETVRRDWCKLARETQDKVLRMILKSGEDKEALTYVKDIVKKLKDGVVDKKELLIKTQLKKPIEGYKAVSPHVVAAMKLKERGEDVGVGSLIEYYLGDSNGRKLVRDKVKLKDEEGKYDTTYYLEKQILPSVEQIFHVFDVEIKEVIDGQKQESLSKWF